MNLPQCLAGLLAGWLGPTPVLAVPWSEPGWGSRVRYPMIGNGQTQMKGEST